MAVRSDGATRSYASNTTGNCQLSPASRPAEKRGLGSDASATCGPDRPLLQLPGLGAEFDAATESLRLSRLRRVAGRHRRESIAEVVGGHFVGIGAVVVDGAVV